MIATDADILLHTLRALEPNQNRVRQRQSVMSQPNPADKCAECGAKAWHTDHRNGREIGLCDDCK